MRVRIGTALDEAAALDVLRADGEATGRQPSKATLLQVRDLLRRPTTLTLLVEDAAPVGLLLAVLGAGGVLRVVLVCVVPDRRGQGAGRALVEALLARYPVVRADVEDGGARRLLAASGVPAAD